MPSGVLHEGFSDYAEVLNRWKIPGQLSSSDSQPGPHLGGCRLAFKESQAHNGVNYGGSQEARRANGRILEIMLDMPFYLGLRLSLVDLRLLINIALEGNLTAGARRSHLSVSAASTRVKNVESEIGLSLLTRESSGVQLTPAGETFVRHAKKVIEDIEAMSSELRGIALGVKGRIRIGATTAIATELLPEVLEAFYERHPDVVVHIHEQDSFETCQAVLRGILDFGIGAGLSEFRKAARFAPWGMTQLALVVRPGHPMAAREAASFAEALEEEFITLVEGREIIRMLQSAAAEAGQPLRIRAHVGNYECVCRLAARGLGVGVAPYITARHYVDRREIAAIPLTDPWASPNLEIFRRLGCELPSYTEELIQMLASSPELSALAFNG